MKRSFLWVMLVAVGGSVWAGDAAFEAARADGAAMRPDEAVAYALEDARTSD